jgi:hypothetical protein
VSLVELVGGAILRCDHCGAEDGSEAGRFPRGWQLTSDGHRCRCCVRLARQLAADGAPVYATRDALREAQGLLPGVVLENEVTATIASRGVRLVGGKVEVVGSGWRATMIRRASTLMPERQVWVVLQVRAA